MERGIVLNVKDGFDYNGAIYRSNGGLKIGPYKITTTEMSEDYTRTLSPKLKTYIGFDLSQIDHIGIRNKYLQTAIGPNLKVSYRGCRVDTRSIDKETSDLAFKLAVAELGVPDKNLRYVSRFVLKEENSDEIKLFDMFEISEVTSFFASRTFKFLVEVEQLDYPKLLDCIPIDKPYFVVNGYKSISFGGTIPAHLERELYYTNATAKSEILAGFTSLELETDEDNINRIINEIICNSKVRPAEYESNINACINLNILGFHIRDIKIIYPDKLTQEHKVDLVELFNDLCITEKTRGSRFDSESYCYMCNTIHDYTEEVDAGLLPVVNVSGVFDHNNEEIPLSPTSVMCKKQVMSEVYVCKHCGNAFMRPYDEDIEWNAFECPNCMGKTEKYRIRRYHHNPIMVYYDYDKEKNENFVLSSVPSDWGGYGVELEVGNAGEKDSESEQVIKLLDEEVYTMHDGSIFREEDYEDGDAYDCGGFEIITYPHTEQALLNMKWERTFKYLLRTGYRSHDIRTCGLHMHISRTLFDDNDAIKKMMCFYEMNFEDVMNFARRRKQDALRWAGTYLNVDRIHSLSTGQIKDKLCYEFDRYDKCNFHDMRYKCVNIQKENTVEVRIMRGTLNLKTFYATLDFLIKIAKKSNEISWEDVLSNNIDKWLEDLNEETFEYMRSRGCFNQPKQYPFPANPETKEAQELQDDLLQAIDSINIERAAQAIDSIDIERAAQAIDSINVERAAQAIRERLVGSSVVWQSVPDLSSGFVDFGGVPNLIRENHNQWITIDDNQELPL